MSFGEHVIQLNDAREMPLLGLGVYKATNDAELKQAIGDAVSFGYHLIDTASFYKNEEQFSPNNASKRSESPLLDEWASPKYCGFPLSWLRTHL